jgi:cytochrome c oxidase subunit 4
MNAQQHVVPVRTNLTIFGILMGLLVLTVAAAFLPVPPTVNFAIAMAIATTKAVLILLFFMHVRFSNKLTWVFSTAAFVWLGILVFLTLCDYLSRDYWLEIPGK